MSTTTTDTTTHGRLRAEDCHLEDLLQILEAGTDLGDYPHADRVEQGVLVYEAAAVRASLARGDELALEAELARAYADGPGIVVFSGAFDGDVVDRVSAVFSSIIEEQHAAGGAVGDHFGKPGANDRVWNALEKLAVADPAAFVDYYANDVSDLASRSWLGPGYQMTSTVNVVNPGGAAQTVHRDYHLGFMDPEQSASYPAHVHALSPTLTLQGAVAHCDMPVESGPTLYLPHSQKYSHGYLAYWLPEFQDYFVANHVQLPLRKGDAVFFNPALFHAAGTNRSASTKRMANLLQVSSAFGRAMETVDRERLVNAIYPTLLARRTEGWTDSALHSVVANSAEGYAFPTNLDQDQPVDGMAPPTQAEVVRAALAEQLPAAELADRLAAQSRRTQSH
jgi:ectoine hydroxylase-related dioxygenase (phytanoyl-CoA dioxygenase family)